MFNRTSKLFKTHQKLCHFRIEFMFWDKWDEICISKLQIK